MDDARWSDVVGKLKDSFDVLEEYDEPLDAGPGTKSVVVFTSPAGKMKLEYIRQPVVEDVQTHGSKRIGGTTAVHYAYSKTEERHSIRAYRWLDEAWVEADARSLTGETEQGGQ